MATLLTDDVFALATLLWGLLWSRGHARGHAMAFATCHGGCLGYLPIGGLPFSKRVGQCWPWQHAHGVAFVLAYGGFLGFDCVPKPWLPCLWLQP